MLRLLAERIDLYQSWKKFILYFLSDLFFFKLCLLAQAFFQSIYFSGG